jgi:DNA-binding NtrC family response regulator
VSERILIVDDDPVQRRLLDNLVRKLGYEPCLADGGEAALALLADQSRAQFHAVVLDLVMPDLDGLGVLAKMRQTGLNVPVIVQTAHGGIDNVITAMRAGAADFVIKPASPERLQISLRNALAMSALQGELARMRHSRAGNIGTRDIVSRSPRMQDVLRRAEKAAASNIPVLIEGQAGVGKALIARAIHGLGERRTKPFVAVNCATIPDDLVESVLFGHEQSALTAANTHAGKFAEASGGTLFLDEVGELSAAAQAKLVQAIAASEMKPVDPRKRAGIDVRLISATNRDLIADVKEGRFREDLFFRLHIFPISVPPLRERPEDIAELARNFLVRFAAEEGKRTVRLSTDAVHLLRRYHWPGNVRQLENAVFRAVVLCEGDTITARDFPHITARLDAERYPISAEEPLATSLAPADEAHDDLQGVASDAFAVLDAAAPAKLDLLDATGNVRPLEELETEAIRYAIVHYRGQMSEVARRLRIGRSTLYRKLDVLGTHS